MTVETQYKLISALACVVMTYVQAAIVLKPNLDWSDVITGQWEKRVSFNHAWTWHRTSPLVCLCMCVRSLTLSFCIQLERELEVCEKESAELQEYANSVLQQIADYCPDILEQVVNALEESCWQLWPQTKPGWAQEPLPPPKRKSESWGIITHPSPDSASLFSSSSLEKDFRTDEQVLSCFMLFWGQPAESY